MTARTGFTTIELVVVLVMIGLTTLVSVIAFRPAPRFDDSWKAQLARARHIAITEGRPVTGWIDSTGRFTAFSSGSVIMDSLRPTPFAGEPHAR